MGRIDLRQHSPEGEKNSVDAPKNVNPQGAAGKLEGKLEAKSNGDTTKELKNKLEAAGIKFGTSNCDRNNGYTGEVKITSQNIQSIDDIVGPLGGRPFSRPGGEDNEGYIQIGNDRINLTLIIDEDDGSKRLSFQRVEKGSV